MEKLIGPVISDEIKARVISFCNRYDPVLTEPYVSLADTKTLQGIKGVDRKLQSFCLSQPPFKTIIGGPNVEHSDKGSVLYLTVMMGALNTTRDKLIKHLKVQSGGFFRAQLLLVQADAESGRDFDAMLENARETFAKPQEFSVKALAIYSRENPGEIFKMDNSYPLTGRK